MKNFYLLFSILIYFFSMQFCFAQEETLILLDASASMLEPFESNPKYVTAIQEVKNILKSTETTKEIGLRTIGISMENALNFLEGQDSFCTATSLLSPIQSNSIDNIKNKLDLVFPLGTTPLTYSLKKSIENDFSSNSFKHIVLITDGGESCDADPCSFIKNIMQFRSDIKIDVIAIGVSSDEIEDLNCLANSTSGQVFNVKTSSDLSNAINTTLNNLNVPFKEKTVKPEAKYVEEVNTTPIIYKNYLLEE